jgi:hypothetical protein
MASRNERKHSPTLISALKSELLLAGSGTPQRLPCRGAQIAQTSSAGLSQKTDAYQSGSDSCISPTD